MRKIYLLLIFITSISFAQKEVNLDNNLTWNTVQADNTTKSVGITYIGDNTIILKNFDINSNTNYAYLTDKQDELSQRVNLMYKFPERKFDDYSFFTYQFNSSLIRKIETDHWFGVGYGLKTKIQRNSDARHVAQMPILHTRLTHACKKAARTLGRLHACVYAGL